MHASARSVHRRNSLNEMIALRHQTQQTAPRIQSSCTPFLVCSGASRVEKTPPHSHFLQQHLNFGMPKKGKASSFAPGSFETDCSWASRKCVKDCINCSRHDSHICGPIDGSSFLQDYHAKARFPVANCPALKDVRDSTGKKVFPAHEYTTAKVCHHGRDAAVRAAGPEGPSPKRQKVGRPPTQTVVRPTRSTVAPGNTTTPRYMRRCKLCPVVREGLQPNIAGIRLSGVVAQLALNLGVKIACRRMTIIIDQYYDYNRNRGLTRKSVCEVLFP